MTMVRRLRSSRRDLEDRDHSPRMYLYYPLCLGSPLDEIQQDALIERLKAEQNKSDMRAHQTIEAGFVAGLVL